MALSLASLKRSTILATPRVLMHGTPGIGKSTFAAGAPGSVFVLTEDGLGTLDVPHFPLARTFDAVMEALAALYSEPHDFKTVVIDSVDWLEPLVWARACKDHGWSSIEDAGYGKGYVAALDLWREYVEGLNGLRDDKDMTIIQIAHTDIKRVMRMHAFGMTTVRNMSPMTATSSSCMPAPRLCCRNTPTSCCLPTTASPP